MLDHVAQGKVIADKLIKQKPDDRELTKQLGGLFGAEKERTEQLISGFLEVIDGFVQTKDKVSAPESAYVAEIVTQLLKVAQENKVGIERVQQTEKLLVDAEEKTHPVTRPRPLPANALGLEEFVTTYARSKPKPDPIVLAYKSGKEIHEQPPLVWALLNAQKIERKDPMVWILENAKDQEKNELIKFAAEGGIKIENQDPIAWLTKQDQRIDGQEPIVWAQRNNISIDEAITSALYHNKQVESQNAAVWAASKYQSIVGNDPNFILQLVANKTDMIAWAAENSQKIDEKDPVIWAMDNKQDIQGKNPLVWAAEKGVKIDKKDPVIWAMDNKQDIQGKNPLVWAAEKGVKIDKQDPIAWAVDNNKNIETLDPIAWARKNKRLIEDKPPLVWKHEWEEHAKEVAKIVLDGSLKDKSILSKTRDFKPGKAKDAAKKEGVSGGEFTEDLSGTQKYILKHAYKSKQDIPTLGEAQHKTDRRDLVNEYLMSGIYKIALYDRAPKNELVTKDGEIFELDVEIQAGKTKVEMVKKPHTDPELHLRSKFFKDFQTVGEFTGGKGYTLKDASQLAKIEGMEKVLASCLLFGELDYHAGNVGVITSKDDSGKPTYTAVKIDHGRSVQEFFSSPAALREGFEKKLKRFYSNDSGHLVIHPEKLKTAIDEMLKIDEGQIDQQIRAKCDNLRHLGFDLAGINFGSNLDGQGNPIQFKIEPYDPAKYRNEDDYRIDSYDKLANHFKEQLAKQKEVLREFSKELAIIEKISPSDDVFKTGGWLREIKGQDIVAWAVTNNKQIDGKDPLDWAADNKKLVEGKDPYVWAMDTNNYTNEEIIKWTLQHGKQIEGEDPVNWAVRRDQLIGGIDPILWGIQEKLDNKVIENAVTSAVYSNKDIDGTNALEWAKVNGIKIADVEPEEWERRAVEGKDMVVWAIANGIKFDGKDPLDLAAKHGQQLDGKDPIQWAVAKDRLIEGQDPLVWALKNNKDIDGKNPMEWIIANTSEADKNILIKIAINEGIKLEDHEPLVWLARYGQQIDNKDPIVWAFEQSQKVAGEDPLVWAVKNDHDIDGKKVLGWAVETGNKIQGKEPLDWAVRSGLYQLDALVKYADSIKKPIEGMSAMDWANIKFPPPPLPPPGPSPLTSPKQIIAIESLSDASVSMSSSLLIPPPPPGPPPASGSYKPIGAVPVPILASDAAKKKLVVEWLPSGTSDSNMVVSNSLKNAGIVVESLTSSGSSVPPPPPPESSLGSKKSATPPSEQLPATSKTEGNKSRFTVKDIIAKHEQIAQSNKPVSHVDSLKAQKDKPSTNSLSH